MRRLAALLLTAAVAAPAAAQIRLHDQTDRDAFVAWFVFLVDARFYEPAPDVVDCAALVRHAVREAFRAHTPDWHRRTGLAVAPGIPDVRTPPPAAGDHWPLFRTGPDPAALAEFADARTIVRFNARLVGRDAAAARPGDLLYFVQPAQRQPDHLMVVVGASRFDSSASDFVVYHTGPDEEGPGEVRKVRLSDLARHPAPRWRPEPGNPAFAGVFRFAFL